MKRSGLPLICLSSLLLLNYCLFPSATFADSKPALPPLRLGMVGPLSGDFAQYGEHIRLGIEAAKFNLQEDGITTQINYEDACLANQVLTAANKLITIDKIDALVGSYCVIGMIPAKKLFEDAKVVAFHTSAVPEELLNPETYIFTTYSRIKDESKRLAEYMVTERGFKRIATFHLISQWGAEYQKFFANRVRELGAEIVSPIEVEWSQLDLRSELARLKASNADAVFMINVGPPFGNILKQAKDINLKSKIFTVNEAEEQAVITAARGAAEGMELFAPEPKDETNDMKEFAALFRKLHGKDPNVLSRHSYDATMVAAKALHGCYANGKYDTTCARDKIYQIKDYSGATGVFSIDADGGTSRTFVHKVVQNGSFMPR